MRKLLALIIIILMAYSPPVYAQRGLSPTTGITATGVQSGGASVSVTAGSSNIVINPSPGTGIFTIDISASPTFGTSVTSPLIIGGTTASSTLTLESTSGAGTTDATIFKTGNQAEAMRITTAGRVGIGTSVPQGLFDIRAAANDNMLVRGHVDLTTGVSIFAVNDANSAFGGLEFASSATDFAAGNVGIGTTAPENNFTVIATSPGNGIKVNGNSGNGPVIYLANSGTVNGGQGLALGNSQFSNIATTGDIVFQKAIAAGRMIFANQASGSILFSTGSATNNDTLKMTLLTSGNLGIGSATPASLLATNDAAAQTVSYTGVLHSVADTSSTASINKIGMDVESTGAWTGTSAVNTGLVVNATGGTTNYAATFNGGNVGIGSTSPAANLDIQSSTITTSVPALNIGQTWNASGTAFTGMVQNITITAAAATSKLFDYQIGGVSTFNLTTNASTGGTFNVPGTTTFNTLASGSIRYSINGTQKMLFGTGDWRVSGDNYLNWTSGSSVGSGDTSIGRKSAAFIQLGIPDAAAPVAQTFGVQNVVAGTTNTAGANFTIDGSQGTGTAAGGALIFQTAPAGTASGSAQNALVMAVAITGAGNMGIGTATPLTKLTVNGNLTYQGSNPTLACGTSPSVDAKATNMSGTVTVGGGIVSSCVVTFVPAFTVYNHCRVTAQTAGIASLAYSYSITTLTITGTSLTSDVFDYQCDGQ